VCRSKHVEPSINFGIINSITKLHLVGISIELHSLFYLETALHVSGGTTTHHQERKQLYLQHLVVVTPLLLPDAVDTVVCAPDDWWRYHPKHVEQFPDKINCVTWKNIVEPDSPQTTIWRIRTACWKTKATNIHSECVIFIFHYNKGCTNAPVCYVIRTVYVLHIFSVHFSVTATIRPLWPVLLAADIVNL
jgi:hypothetical protein